MRRKTGFLLLLTAFILGSAAIASRMPSRAYAQDAAQPDRPSVQVLEADERHLIVELTVPTFEAQSVTHDGVEYQRLRVAEWPLWGQPGQPQLPMFTVPLGMPGPGEPQVVVTETETELIEGVWPYPAPALELGGTEDVPQVVEVFSFDPKAYSADTFYPGPLAETTSVGWLRDQPMFQLRVYPFQYNPLRREMRVCRRIKLLVTFPEGDRRAQSSPEFERILEQTLFNYDSLPQPQGARSLPPSTVGRALVDSQTQVKLRVTQSGLYRVTYEDLWAVAPDLTQCDPRHLGLSNQGSDVAILFEGEVDGTFDPGDGFIFYGEAIDSQYTWKNVYWLSDRGAPGLRMLDRDGTPGAATSPTAFSDHRHYEENHTYWRALPNGEGQDHWFWERLLVSSSTPVSAD